MSAYLSGPGSHASHEAASASSPKASIPSAVDRVMADLQQYPANFGGDTLASIAISLVRIADALEARNEG